MFDGYVHGHRPLEHGRLVDQADTLTQLLHADTGYPATPEYFDAGIADLLRTTESDGTFNYTFFKATAHT